MLYPTELWAADMAPLVYCARRSRTCATRRTSVRLRCSVRPRRARYDYWHHAQVNGASIPLLDAISVRSLRFLPPYTVIERSDAT